MKHQWQERGRPARLERRYEFGSYQALRDFLDQAAELSEREGLYPDMGFGRDYVNMTIHPDESSGVLELSLIHISEPTRQESRSRMPSSA